MTCARCHALAAELAAAREQLAAWEAYEAEPTATSEQLSRMGRWQARFGLTASEALILIALVDRKGAPMTPDALLRQTRLRPGVDHGREVQSNVVQQLVSRCRRALSDHRLGKAIRTVKHVGYAIDAEFGATLKSRAAEA